jgi:hypothetical protein
MAGALEVVPTDDYVEESEFQVRKGRISVPRARQSLDLGADLI